MYHARPAHTNAPRSIFFLFANPTRSLDRLLCISILTSSSSHSRTSSDGSLPVELLDVLRLVVLADRPPRLRAAVASVRGALKKPLPTLWLVAISSSPPVPGRVPRRRRKRSSARVSLLSISCSDTEPPIRDLSLGPALVCGLREGFEGEAEE